MELGSSNYANEQGSMRCSCYRTTLERRNPRRSATGLVCTLEFCMHGKIIKLKHRSTTTTTTTTTLTPPPPPPPTTTITTTTT